MREDSNGYTARLAKSQIHCGVKDAATEGYAAFASGGLSQRASAVASSDLV
jgi:hypothetical protein